MNEVLTKDEVIARLRSVMYLDDALVNKDPKFHTVAVHEAECARWVAVETRDGDGNRKYEVARFTPGVLKRAIDSADKNFDDFDGRDEVMFDEDIIGSFQAKLDQQEADRIAEVDKLNAKIAELQESVDTKAAMIEEYATAQLAEADRWKAGIQAITNELEEAFDNKGWFSGAGWWKRVMRKHGAAI